MADYIYEPLPPIAEVGVTPPFSRILWLHPGSGNEPLSGRLQIINVEQPPGAYEALSYTWGTDPVSNYLWLGSYPLPIRPNLEAALLHLRLPNLNRLLWVDALCIDQSSLDERSRQVQYMRLVYKYATCVIVWVGTKTPGVETAFEMARRLGHIQQFAKQEQQRQLQSGNNAPNHEHATNTLATNLLSTMPPESMQYLKQLLDRPYFSRCWCVQEVVACRWALLKCEELEMDIMDLLSCIFVVANSEGKIQLDKTYGLWFQIYDARRAQPAITRDVQGSLGPLLHLLDISRSLQATDIRDKIYSLQGVSDEGLQPVLALTQVMGKTTWWLNAVRKGVTKLNDVVNSAGPNSDFGRPLALKANYRRPAVDVYIDVTRFMVQKSPRVLEVLNHVMHTTDPEHGEYPSWVPKWFEPRTAHIMTGTNLAGFCDGHFRYFAQIGDYTLTGRPERPRVLTLDGFRVDTVTSVTDFFTFETIDPLQSIEKIYKAWAHLFGVPMVPRQGRRYRDGQMLDIAFCKAVAAHPLGIIFHVVLEGSTTGLDLNIGHDFRARGEAVTRDSERMMDAFMNHLPSGHQDEGAGSNISPDDLNFLAGLRLYATNRRVFLTQEGRLGLGPRMMQAGDQVVVLFGNRFPFVLRPRPDHHVFVGQCYIVDEDVMTGKVTQRLLRPAQATPGFAPPKMTFDLW